MTRTATESHMAESGDGIVMLKKGASARDVWWPEASSERVNQHKTTWLYQGWLRMRGIQGDKHARFRFGAQTHDEETTRAVVHMMSIYGERDSDYRLA